VQIAGRFGHDDVITGGGDWTGDHLNDLFVRDAASGDSSILPGRGDGTFQRPLGPFGRMAGASDLSAGDVAGSRAPDLVAVSGDLPPPHNRGPGRRGLGRRRGRTHARRCSSAA